MDIGVFDNFEEDGQLTLFGIEEELEELQKSARERAARAGKRQAQKTGEAGSGRGPAEETEEAASEERPAEETGEAGSEERPAEETEEAASDERPAEETQEAAAEQSTQGRPEKQTPEGKSAGQQSFGQTDGIRIRTCSSCGKLLFVKEENGVCHSACNACGIQYTQILR